MKIVKNRWSEIEWNFTSWIFLFCCRFSGFILNLNYFFPSISLVFRAVTVPATKKKMECKRVRCGRPPVSIVYLLDFGFRENIPPTKLMLRYAPHTAYLWIIDFTTFPYDSIIIGFGISNCCGLNFHFALFLNCNFTRQLTYQSSARERSHTHTRHDRYNAITFVTLLHRR